MECDICGNSIAIWATPYRVGERTVCKNCLSKAQEELKQKKANKPPEEKHSPENVTASNSTPTNTPNFNEPKFKTLQSFGSVYSGIGWFIVVVGIVGILVGLGQEQRSDIIIIVGSVILALSGLGFIITGQLVNCFVSIENNTRGMYQLLADQFPSIVE
ncbi:MAG: hypothetical protein K9N46_04485 [Candidatus Marinimicrobia bacterium]|nr:hypothetical protein [Candidatus Neomarinimicrobiota bacterium]MCF7829355.1 hypothetical protein [Candidatus Neomarinimicrobiota bacterium]MCF7879982.1 hypothetical protein [Candidatus Neomarinimicrobiota bacterium]